jgi:hypothetical protein
MQGVRNFKDWQIHDAAVLKEYSDLGGSADDL